MTELLIQENQEKKQIALVENGKLKIVIQNEKEHQNTNNTTNSSLTANNTTNNTVRNTATNNTTNNTSKTNNNVNTLAKTGLSDTNGIVALIVVVCGVSAIYSYKKVNDYKKL